MTVILTLAAIAAGMTIYLQGRSIRSHTRAIEAINVTNVALVRTNAALERRVALLEGGTGR